MTAIDKSDLLGSRLAGVHYDLLEWEDEPAARSILDQVSKGVILAFDTLSVLLRWDLRPPVERLVMVSNENRQAGPLTRRVDVSLRWKELLGSQVVGVSWSEQETSDGLQPWAVTFALADAGELVVALGELVNGIPAYLPDSLIVTASREAGLSYMPSASLMPAWTDPWIRHV